MLIYKLHQRYIYIYVYYYIRESIVWRGYSLGADHGFKPVLWGVRHDTSLADKEDGSICCVPGIAMTNISQYS